VSCVHQCNPSLILLDIQLPDISGFDIIDLLKEDPLTGAIPVIAVTACAHAEEQRLAKIKGFQGYVTKPVDMSQMLTLIQAYIP
jgi:CheY-like chemotaxis protein